MEEWPLVGRREELDLVLGGLDRPTPGAVLLAGSAGVGKTRLSREVASAIGAKGWEVRYMLGSRAASSIPFGAVAPLLRGPTDASPLELLAEARAGLTDDGNSRHLLVVDDAHLLDAGSATLVQQVVTGSVCSVVLTVRSGDLAPDAIESLWKDGWAERVELQALSRGEVATLLAAALDGTVDGGSSLALFELSAGNALYLRELVRGALDNGQLQRRAGVWQLRGRPAAPPRLLELIDARLADLDRPSRAALEVLAVADGLGLDEMSELTDPEVLEHLESSGFIEIRVGPPPVVTLGHPLYGDAVRSRMPVTRRQRVHQQLAAALEQSGLERPSDLLRFVTWRLAAGQPPDAGRLSAAARQAFVVNDLPLAERLGRAARDAGAGVDAGIVLGEVSFLTGRPEEAEVILAPLSDEATTDQERANIANARAHNLAHMLGREDLAEQVLRSAIDSMSDPELVDMLTCRLGVNQAFAARPVDSLATVAPVLARPSSSTFFRAAWAASHSYGLLGQSQAALDIARRGIAAHRLQGATLRQLPESQYTGATIALLLAGRFNEADGLAVEGYEASVLRDREGQASFALLRGLLALARGQVLVARRLCEEGCVVNRELSDDVALRWTLGGVALSYAMAGEAAGALEAVREIDELPPGTMPIIDLDAVERGRAWTALAAGDRAAAIERLRAAAGHAAATGQIAVELLLRHDLLRIGLVDEADAVAMLAAHCDGPLPAALAGHAVSVVAGDGAALEAAGERLESLGALLLAAEVFIAAAGAHRAAGDSRPAAAADERGHRLLDLCDGARPPSIGGRDPRPRLTSREREVAELAAAGLSSRDIAEKLFVSTRTVDNHLQRAYVKLGVSRREDLRAALA